MKGVAGGEYPMTVAVRIRPLSDAESASREAVIARRVDSQMVVLLDPSDDADDVLRANRSREKRYVFDHVFDSTSGQEEVYLSTTRFLVESVVNGYNGTVFAYGATGSGKTYTMLGTEGDPGIYVRALDDIFDVIQRTQNDNLCHVSISYLEIYNEMVRDLLNPASGYLEMREDPRSAVQVAGLSEVTTASTAEIMELLQAGNQERMQEPTKANKTSSRSHAVLQVTVKRKTLAPDLDSSFSSAAAAPAGQLRVGRLFLVDLAGSERAANTQNRGKRMVEGAHINRSLLALGNCINALSEMKNSTCYRYVNYRDSKLTRLLKDSLGGNCRTVMVAHLAPAASHFEESRNTLIYAERAKKIKNKVRRNMTDVSYHVTQYASIIMELKEEIGRLRNKLSSALATSPGPQVTPHPPFSRTSADIKSVHNEVVGGTEGNHGFLRLKEQLITNLKEQVELRRTLMELNNVLAEVDAEAVRQQSVIAEWELSTTALPTGGIKKDEEDNAKGNDSEAESELSKRLELAGLSKDDLEPPEVSEARGELVILRAEKRNAEKKKKLATQELRVAKKKAADMEETLPKQATSDEQKEIIALLLHINELEIDRAEMQALLYMKENDIAGKAAALARHADYNALANEIIVKQHELIGVHGVPISRELGALYEAYCSSVRSAATAPPFPVGSSPSRALQRDHVTIKLPSIPPKVPSGGGGVGGSTDEATAWSFTGYPNLPPHQYATPSSSNTRQPQPPSPRQQMLALLRPYRKYHVNADSHKLFMPSSKLPPLKDEEHPREKTAQPPRADRQSRAEYSYGRSGLARLTADERRRRLPAVTTAIVTNRFNGERFNVAVEKSDATSTSRSGVELGERHLAGSVEATTAPTDDDDDSFADTPRSFGPDAATPSSSGVAADEDPFSPEVGNPPTSSFALPNPLIAVKRKPQLAGFAATAAAAAAAANYDDAARDDASEADDGELRDRSRLLERSSALAAVKSTARKRSLQRLMSNSSTEQKAEKKASATKSRLPRYVVSNKRYSAAGQRRRPEGSSDISRRTPAERLARKSSRTGGKQNADRNALAALSETVTATTTTVTTARVQKVQADAPTSASAAAGSTQTSAASSNAGPARPSIPGYGNADIKISGFGLK